MLCVSISSLWIYGVIFMELLLINTGGILFVHCGSSNSDVWNYFWDMTNFRLCIHTVTYAIVLLCNLQSFDGILVFSDTLRGSHALIQ